MALAEGTPLGPYRIIALIGSGGMGDVYRALDPRLGRDVAIKVLRGEVDRVALDRFEREARAVASLAHPNTLAVFDVGEENGVPYLVSELLTGGTLRQRLRGPLHAAETLSIVRQISDALIAAHDKAIVHRDLKPENVFVLPNGTVKLLDFGLVREIKPASADAETRLVTATGTLVGTVAYMAPEQARGLDCDGRTDLFALGVIFYEMLAGRRPFTGATLVDVLAAVLTAEPDRFPPGVVPPPLEAIVFRTLAKDPADRFASVREFLFALDTFTSGGDAAEQQIRPLTPSVAVLPFVDLSPHRDHEYFCDGMAEEILNALTRLPGLRVASASRSFQFRGRDVDARAAASELGVQTVLEGSLRSAGDRLRVGARLVDAAEGHVLWSEQFDRDAADVFGVQDEIARRVVAAVKPRLIATLPSRMIRSLTDKPEAYALYLKGRFHWNKRTERGITDSIDCFNEARALDPQFARAAAGLADAYSMLAIHNFRAPDEVMPPARTAALEALALDHALAEAHASLGLVRGVYEWERQEAVAEYEQMLRLDAQYAAGLQSYATHGLVPLGRFDEALDLLQRALALDPVSVPINGTVGFVLTLADRAAEAADVLRRTLDLAPHPITHFFLGNALIELGDSAEAIEHHQAAVSLSAGHPPMVSALAYTLAKAGNRPAARAVFARLVDQSRHRYVSPVAIARVHAVLGETDAALAALERATQLRAADLTWINVEQPFRRLAMHPAFTALLKRLQLPGRSVQ
jgi:TolB-like protein/tetratricopeptide (TPR) repeat protein